MTQSTQPPVEQSGFFVDPLEDWANDDLLLSGTTRTHFQTHHPDVFRILDWPELRAFFGTHNTAAMVAKRKAQSRGVLAIALTTVGLLLAAFSQPLATVGGPTTTIAGWFSAALTVFGSCLALEHFFHGKAKHQWLQERYLTERVRQFYFQFLIQHIGLAADAMADEATLDRYRKLRDREFADFTNIRMASIIQAIDAMKKDEANARIWLDPDWQEPASPPPSTPQVIELLNALFNQRLGIQDRYTSLKLAKTMGAPGWRSSVADGMANIFTLTMPVTALAIAVALMFGHTSNSTLLVWLVAAQASGGALVGALRIFDEGLRWSDDARRYAWYLAHIEVLESQFSTGGTVERIQVLREMERLSYEELRQFTMAHERARFLI